MAFRKQYSCWMVAFLFCSFMHTGYCQINEGDQTTEKERDPIEEGMDPLYTMTVTFLDVVHPDSKDNLLELIIGDEDSDSDLSDWQTWAKHYVGYLVCIAVGLVFILVMPIVGLCFCCCRCCGNCGGTVKEKRGKRDKCQWIICSIIFGILLILILGGMVCAFVTNELIRQQTSQDENAVLPTVVASIQDVEGFKEQLFDDINVKMIQKALEEIEVTTTSLRDVPETVTDSISADSGYEGAIDELDRFVLRTEEIGNTLKDVDRLTDQLEDHAGELQTALGTYQTNFDGNSVINACTMSDCTAIKNSVASLSVTTAPITELPDVTDKISTIDNVLVDNDFRALIEEGQRGLDVITAVIDGGTSAVIELSIAAVDLFSSNISAAADDMTEEVNSQLSLQKLIDDLKTYEDDVEKYGDYRFYAGIGLCCVLLLILLFAVLGALFGSCGSPPSDDAGHCNKGVGANLLMASVGFIFFFSWLLMLVVVVLFILGGLVHTELCRIIVNIEDSPAIHTVDKFIEDNVVSNASINFKFSDILSDCKENEPLYQVLHLENVVNLTDVLNLDNYNVRDEINKLKDVTVSSPMFDIYTQKMETELDKLKNSGLDGIDFSMFNDLQEDQILTGDLNDLADDMKQLAESSSGDLKTALEQFVDDLNEIIDGEYGDMMSTRTNLKNKATVSQNLITNSSATTYSQQVTNIQTSLSDSEDNIEDDWVSNTANALADAANGIIDDIQEYLNDIVITVEQELARCKPVYTALDDTINSVCVVMLEPFNGFWFSFGWCLFFFIPCIIVAVHLVGLYRRPPPNVMYHPEGKSFDDPNFDAYAGAGDNVAMQERNAGRYGGPGNQNTGYQRDDYTASRPNNYRPDRYPDKQYDPGYQQRGYQPSNSNQGHPSAPAETPPNPPHYYNGQKYYN